MAGLKWAGGITSIRYIPDLGAAMPPMAHTPAAVNRETGEMLVNLKIWNGLTPDQKYFILLHEAGHLVLRSQDEKKVDEWAFREYQKRGYRLSQSIYALTKVLNFNNPEHLERANLQLQRAQKADTKHRNNGTKTKNQKKKVVIQRTEGQRPIEARVQIPTRWQSGENQKEKVAMDRATAISNGMLPFTGQYERADGNSGAVKFRNTIEDIEDVLGTFGDLVFRRDRTDPTAQLAAQVNAENAKLKKQIEDQVTKKDYTTYYVAGGLAVLVALVFLLKK